jgi:CRISPR-associated protein Cas2
VMKEYGLRVQKSIFEVTVTEQQFAEMNRRAEAEIVAEEDGVRFSRSAAAAAVQCLCSVVR